jgi:hypothetical protein
MANTVQQEWKEELMQATTNTSLGGTVSCLFTTDAYAAADVFVNPGLSAVFGDGSNNFAGRENLGSKTFGTVAANVFDAADVVFASVNTGGTSVTAISVFTDTATDTTSRLVAYWDSVTGMPFTTSSGAQVTIAWSASGLFAL